MKIQVTGAAAAMIVTFTLCLAAGPSAASEIYKWTDENGNVHFGDKPEGEKPERIAIASRATDRGAVRSQVAARNEARTARAEEASAAATEGPSAEEQAAEAANKAKQCATYRDRMQKMVASRRIYRENATGEREYLSDAEMLTARAEVEQRISEFCNP